MQDPLVMIISPHADTRRLITLNLRRRGYRIGSAANQVGLADSCPTPDLIILDVDPPDETGWELAATLRQSVWAQGVPLVLLVSASPRARQIARLKPVDWVEKPMAIDALLRAVRESLGRWESDSPSVENQDMH